MTRWSRKPGLLRIGAGRFRLWHTRWTVALLLAGCGGTSGTVHSGGSGAPRVADAATVGCGSVYDPTDLADAPPASSLPDGPAGAIDDGGAPAFDPSQDWKVVYQSDDRVDLVRELDEPFDNGGGDIRTHESRTLERITGASNVPDGTWLLVSRGPCTQRLVTDDDLGEADLTLADTPSPGAFGVHSKRRGCRRRRAWLGEAAPRGGPQPDWQGSRPP